VQQVAILFLNPFHTNLFIVEPVDSAKVIEGIAYGELSDQGGLLRHVTYSRSRDAGALAARFSSQNPYFPTIEISNPNNAGQQGCLAASAGP